jgi:hypothetical protein
VTERRPAMNRISRRALLSGAATAGLLAPFVRPLRALAGDAPLPPRIVFWFQPNGVEEEQWFPAGGARALATDADLGPSLAPLAPYRARINIVDDVELYSTYHEPLRVAPHDQGCAELWTNRECGPARDGASFTHGGDFDTWSFPAGPSLDQYLADSASVRGSAPIHSLDLGVWVGGSRTNKRMSYTAAGAPVSPENDPRAAFARVFGGGVPTGDAERAAREQRRRQRVLDRVNGDLANLRARLGARDRETLDRYAFAIESLEAEIVGSSTPLMCTAPELDPGISDPRADAQIPAVGRMHMKLLAAALACDVTRVGTLMWMGSEPTNRMTWLEGAGASQEYHLCSHRALPGIDNATQVGWLRETDRWFASQLAFFLSELDRLDPSGRLSASTIVVCGNELRHGNVHSRDRMPFLIVGGEHYFRTGFYRKYGEKRRSGDLLAEIGRAMGVELDSFGDPSYCGGPALGLTAAV